MRLSKRISLTIFLSAIMFVLCISATAIKHEHLYGFDQYGWPNVFFTVKYDEGKMVQELFDINLLLIDFSVWLGLNTTIMIIIRLLKVKRTPATVTKERLEKIRASSNVSNG